MYEAMNCLIFNLIPRISLLRRDKQVVKPVSSLFGQVAKENSGLVNSSRNRVYHLHKSVPSTKIRPRKAETGIKGDPLNK